MPATKDYSDTMHTKLRWAARNQENHLTQDDSQNSLNLLSIFSIENVPQYHVA